MIRLLLLRNLFAGVDYSHLNLLTELATEEDLEELTGFGIVKHLADEDKVKLLLFIAQFYQALIQLLGDLIFAFINWLFKEGLKIQSLGDQLIFKSMCFLLRSSEVFPELEILLFYSEVCDVLLLSLSDQVV